MNPNLCRLALRPRDPFEVLDLTFRLIREMWRPIGKMSLLLVLPLWLLSFPIAWLTEGHWGLALAPIVIAPALQAPYTVLVGRLLFADQVRLRDVLLDVVRRSPALVASWAIGLLGWVIAGAISCFTLAPATQAGLLYLGEAALLERVGAARGLRRTLRLASGHAGIALVGALSWWVLTAWFAMVTESFGQTLTGSILQLGAPFGVAMEGKATPWLVGGLLLAQPFHAIYRLLLYVDVRTRVEGWDLQVALRAAGLAK
jgi:hypothetical protein